MKKFTLHICVLQKFIPAYVKLVQENFQSDFQFFWLIGDSKPYPVKQDNNIYKVGKGKINKLKGYAILIKKMNQADKIVIHGIFDLYPTILIWAMPWVHKKCYWVIWGGDLYTHKLGKKDRSWRVHEFFKRPIIRRFGYVVTGTPGDFELAKQYYDAKGKHIASFNYPSNIYREIPENIKKSTGRNILVGNSADPTNNHLSVFERLKKIVPSDAKVYCPLSYGDVNYSKIVIETGKKIFGDRFVPILDFMEFQEYLNFLASIDIAVFDHPRQQAFGNAISLLGFGKKVYINPCSTLNGVFEQYSISVYDSNSLDLSRIDQDTAEKNRRRVKEFFSEQALIDSLKKWIE